MRARIPRPLLFRLSVLGVGLFVAHPCAAQQESASATPDSSARVSIWLGSPAEERARLDEILGGAPWRDALVRSPSTALGAGRGRGGLSIRLLAPAIHTVWNSEIPVSQNDGALWSGRGGNLAVSGGARLSLGRVALVLLPEITYSENRDFRLPETRLVGRSSFSAPWYAGDFSADLPNRFGDAPLPQIGAGQSSLTAHAGPMRLGLATESQWWGPATRNSIVLGNSAGGFPHAFVQTAAPLRTRVGDFTGKWIAGSLTESLYFDTVTANDRRALSGAVVTYAPAAEPDLTLGIARTVVSASSDDLPSPGAALAALTRWRGTSNAPRDSAFQILSFFARWVLPNDGFELYSEWARMALPSSPVDLLTSPAYSQGYTLGLQWARDVGRGQRLRIQSEITYLEESATYDRLPTRSFYVSPSVVQGYTERGQPLGAAIGPGGSSQWLAFDLFGGASRVGLFAGRTRFGNDVYYTLPVIGRSYLSHDVAVYAGARAGLRLLGTDVEASAAVSRRYNFLFQNPAIGIEGEKAVDVRNLTLQLSVLPTFRPAR